jgi:SAM-dependent methyltransferase
MLSTSLEKFHSFNANHPWSHNDFYHRWMLRQLPGRLSRTIDVGCGTGNFVRAVTRRAGVAEGIDTDLAAIDAARERSTGYSNATFDVLDLMNVSGDGQYDAVTAIAVVHHLPLGAALSRMRLLLAPGGTIVIVGCYRAQTCMDHLVGVVAIPVNMISGLLRSSRAHEARIAMSAPTAPPESTLPEVRAIAAKVLPGARIRRRLFWRYSLVYKAPTR